jgi:hypothetical protein
MKGSNMRGVRYTMLAVVLILIMGQVGCNSKEATSTSTTDAGSATSTTATPTDYSQPAHWLAAPSSPDKTADVFYVYPTAYSRTATSDPNFCTVDDPQMMKGTQAAFQQQATAFVPLSNVYAPYYRQVDAMYQLALPVAQQNANIQQVPLVDVTAAFEYYLRHYSNGRPFILVGHSRAAAQLPGVPDPE